MDGFTPTPLECGLSVSHIVTLHRFHYTPDFLFTGESHDFWELVFIKSGSVGVMAGSTGYTLRRGEAIFHAPCEYHNIWANGDSAEVFIVTFISKSRAMKFFEKRLLTVGAEEEAIIDRLLALGGEVFEEPQDLLYQKKLCPKPGAGAAELQLLRLYLEELLLSLMRNSKTIDRSVRKSAAAGNKNGTLITDAIIRELCEHIYGNITLDEVCALVSFSKSYLKALFKKNTGYSIMDYYAHLKLERAKILLDDGLTVSDIAEKLGFSSVHYFSRSFKQKTGLSPTEFRNRKEKDL